MSQTNSIFANRIKTNILILKLGIWDNPAKIFSKLERSSKQILVFNSYHIGSHIKNIT